MGRWGPQLQRKLGDLPTEVRALGRDDDLHRAFADADVDVHLAGTLRPARGNGYRKANVETVRRTIAALEGSSARRIVFLSYVGADPSARNEYLRTKGEAEELFVACRREVVIFRCSLIYGPPDEPGPTVTALLSKAGRAVSVLGDGRQKVVPVYREDVVEAIVSALPAASPSGRFDLPGPEVMTLDQFVVAVNGAEARIRHIPAALARVLGHVVPTLTPALIDIVLFESVGDPNEAGRLFGPLRHRVADTYVLRRAETA